MICVSNSHLRICSHFAAILFVSVLFIHNQQARPRKQRICTSEGLFLAIRDFKFEESTRVTLLSFQSNICRCRSSPTYTTKWLKSPHNSVPAEEQRRPPNAKVGKSALNQQFSGFWGGLLRLLSAPHSLLFRQPPIDAFLHVTHRPPPG